MFIYLAAALTTVIGLFAKITEDYLSKEWLFNLDLQVAQYFHQIRTPHMLSFFYFWTNFGEVSIIVLASLILSITLWLSRNRILAASIWLSLVPSDGLAYIGKIVFHRQRPNFRAIVENSYSYPSGHATTAIAFYGIIAYLLVRKSNNIMLKIATLSGFIGIVGLIDVSRLYLGVHYISDVLAGNLVGLAGALSAITVIEWLDKKTKLQVWNNFKSAYILPSLVCILLLAIIFYIKEPVFSL